MLSVVKVSVDMSELQPAKDDSVVETMVREMVAVLALASPPEEDDVAVVLVDPSAHFMPAGAALSLPPNVMLPPATINVDPSTVNGV